MQSQDVLGRIQPIRVHQYRHNHSILLFRDSSNTDAPYVPHSRNNSHTVCDNRYLLHNRSTYTRVLLLILIWHTVAVVSHDSHSLFFQSLQLHLRHTSHTEDFMCKRLDFQLYLGIGGCDRSD